MLENSHNVEGTLENRSAADSGVDYEYIVHQEEAFWEDAPELDFDYTPKKSSHVWGIGYWDSVYDLETDTAVAVDKLVDIRPENLDDLKPGDQLLIRRDSVDSRYLWVCRMDGAVVGRLHWTNCACMIPMLEDGTIKQVEIKVHSVEPGLLQVELIASFQGLIQCTVYRIDSNLMDTRPQEMGKLACAMSVNAVKALFELYNRFVRAYDQMSAFAEQINLPVNEKHQAEMNTVLNTLKNSFVQGLDYSGGDQTHFGAFVQDKIQEEPERYGVLAEYEIDPYARLEEILEQHCLPEETRYWLEGERVTEEEFQDKWTDAPRFKTLALIDGKQIEEIPDSQIGQTIFGDRLVAFADLSLA